MKKALTLAVVFVMLFACIPVAVTADTTPAPFNKKDQ